MSAEALIQLQNKEAVLASLRGIEGDVQAEVVKKLGKGGLEVRNALRDSLPEAPAADQHSAPGGVPFSQTGETKEQIKARILPLMLNEPVTLKIYVTAKGFVGRMLEFGTSVMAARPWFFSGIMRMFPFLKDNVEQALAEVVKRRNAKK